MMHGSLKILGNENCHFSEKKFKNCTTSNIEVKSMLGYRDTQKTQECTWNEAVCVAGKDFYIFYAVVEIVLVFRSEPQKQLVALIAI